MHHGRPFTLFGRRAWGGIWGFLVGLTVPLGGVPLDFVQTPAGSGLYSIQVDGSWLGLGTANAHDWSFEGEVGDLMSARIEAVVGNSRPRIRVLNAAGTSLHAVDGGTDGLAAVYAFSVPAPGTYRVRVYTDHVVSDYSMRVVLARGPRLEVEGNDSLATANRLISGNALRYAPDKVLRGMRGPARRWSS